MTRREHYRRCHLFWQDSLSITSWLLLLMLVQLGVIIHYSESLESSTSPLLASESQQQQHVLLEQQQQQLIQRSAASRVERQVKNQVDEEDAISNVIDNNNNCPHQCICLDKKQNAKTGTTSVLTSSSSSSSSSFLTVTCSSLNLTSVPQGIPTTVKRLDLSENNLTWIGPYFFTGLNQIQELNLKSNAIEEIDSSALNNLVDLNELTLSRNQFKHFPAEALQFQRGIGLLNLEFNQISNLEANLFPKKSKLFALLLGHNLIENIDEDAFTSLSSLQLLELNDNKLTEVPSAISKLPNLEELTLANNRILSIDSPFYELIPKILLLEIRGNPLQWIHPQGFTHLQHLKKLILSDVRNLTEFPHLNGSRSLEILRIDRCSLHSIPKDICSQTPKLKSLDLKSNKIHQLPQLLDCQSLKILDLSSNNIEDLADDDIQFAAMPNLHVLHLAQNRVNQIKLESFYGLGQLQTLDLSYNNIQYIHPEAFVPLTKLVDLNLGNNYFPQLPSSGLQGVVHLKTFNNPNLREFPGAESFPAVRTLVLSYAYHCCQFNAKSLSSVFDGSSNFINGGDAVDTSLLQEDVIYPTDKEDFNSVLSSLNLTDLWAGFENFSDRGVLEQEFINSFSVDPQNNGFETSNGEDSDNNRGNHHFHHRKIQCIPQPGPFLPCNDLFDWWTLRCGVWIVFLLALMGNGTVVFVLIFSRTKLDVPRFLVCNLAIADFFMGIYLGFLAVVDAATLGEFRKYAIPWQFSSGCQMAGFFGVLSSELSVYTLAVITMERHYAITHAMHLNKRLSLRHASYIMLVGWTFSLLMAILPLFGISDYRKFAVCLPFETNDLLSLSYVVFLMFANGVAFTILMGCYLKMYCSIRGSQAWNSNDTRIAKRMALLVFTDLLCWFPIAFFSLTAIFGLQLVSLEEAKVFTVFILPFNSCCNPFLYAILTKQFKKDCVLICKAIEESRVTRGIGRCRNSSNFSNRQTAPNTGSLVEKSSRDGQPCICHSGLHPIGGDVNGNAKYRFLPTPERLSHFGPLGRFVSRFILCQNANKDSRQARDDYRMRNVRRYLYTTANVTNFPPDAEKHQRHPSVSSDNFSSSRSDSWRAQGRCGIPLRLLEPRRRNSWAVTRKPSQDSSLSNSRNDSSATSNSTATWRLSRSSVSSDATNHSGGGKSSLKKTSTIILPVPSTSSASTANVLLQQASHNSHLQQDANTNVLVHSPTMSHKQGAVPVPSGATSTSDGNNANTSINTKRPKTLQFNDESIQVVEIPISQTASNKKKSSLTKSNIGEETSSNSTSKSRKYNKKEKSKNRNKHSDTSIEHSSDGDNEIEEDELSAKIATNRPRLVRQSAFFSEDVVIEPEICPVHGSLVNGTYDDENDDDGVVSDIAEDDEDDEADIDASSPILRKSSGNGNGGGPFIIVQQQNPPSNTFIPYNVAMAIASRRLSTISSRDTVSLSSKDESSSSAAGISAEQNNKMIPSETSQSVERKLSDQATGVSLQPPASGSGARWHSASEIGPQTSTSNSKLVQIVKLEQPLKATVSGEINMTKKSTDSDEKVGAVLNV